MLNVPATLYAPCTLKALFRAKLSRRQVQNSKPLLLKLDGKFVCPKEVNDVLANQAVLTNLNPDDCTSHGMRMGRCTDLVKMGMDYLIIKKMRTLGKQYLGVLLREVGFHRLSA